MPIGVVKVIFLRLSSHFNLYPCEPISFINWVLLQAYWSAMSMAYLKSAFQLTPFCSALYSPAFLYVHLVFWYSERVCKPYSSQILSDKACIYFICSLFCVYFLPVTIFTVFITKCVCIWSLSWCTAMRIWYSSFQYSTSLCATSMEISGVTL